MTKKSRLILPSPLIDRHACFHDFNPDALKSLPPFAISDLKIALNFLKQYAHNLATFEAYRREIERLMQWAFRIKKMSLLALKREEMEDYIAFCLNPPLAGIGVKKTPRFIDKEGKRMPHPQWRPFVVLLSKSDHKKNIKPDKKNYHLSQKSLQDIFTVISSFYQYLMLEEKSTLNPVSLIRQKSKYLQKRQTKATVMRLTEQQWHACLETAETLAAHNPAQHERTLFMLTAFYLLYLRISELAASTRWTPQMGHFYQDSEQRWWFKTVGKGNKMRDIAVSDSMLLALKRYRKTLGLSALPLPNEQTFLLPKEKGKGPMTSTRHIRRQLQVCFDNAVVRLRKAGFSSDADALEIATVHWLRHTGISDDINKRGRPVAHVRDDAGHSSSAITDRYNDIELAERYQSAKDKKSSQKNFKKK